MLGIRLSQLSLQELKDLQSLKGHVPGWENFTVVEAGSEIHERYNALVAKARTAGRYGPVDHGQVREFGLVQ